MMRVIFRHSVDRFLDLRQIACIIEGFPGYWVEDVGRKISFLTVRHPARNFRIVNVDHY
jgi:hypothetical protein